MKNKDNTKAEKMAVRQGLLKSSWQFLFENKRLFLFPVIRIMTFKKVVLDVSYYFLINQLKKRSQD